MARVCSRKRHASKSDRLLVNGIYLDHGEQERLIREKCDRKWSIPHSTKTRISRSKILRWVRLYKASNGKLGSLYPGTRSDCGKSRALDEETVLSLIRTREELPKATVPRLVEEMKRRGMIDTGEEFAPFHCLPFFALS